MGGMGRNRGGGVRRVCVSPCVEGYSGRDGDNMGGACRAAVGLLHGIHLPLHHPGPSARGAVSHRGRDVHARPGSAQPNRQPRSLRYSHNPERRALPVADDELPVAEELGGRTQRLSARALGTRIEKIPASTRSSTSSATPSSSSQWPSPAPAAGCCKRAGLTASSPWRILAPCCR